MTSEISRQEANVCQRASKIDYLREIHGLDGTIVGGSQRSEIHHDIGVFVLVHGVGHFGVHYIQHE